MAESMESARGLQEGPPRVEEKPGWWATPAVVALFGFGAATLLFGLSQLPPPYCTGFYTGASCGGGSSIVFSVAFFFGGIAQAVAGLIALRKGNLFGGSAFATYGAFWVIFSTLNYSGGAGGYGLAAFAFIFLLISLSFLINSMKHGWGIFVVFLLLFVEFILLTVLWWQLGAGNSISSGEHWAIGGEIILTGIAMWYVATADLTNWNHGRKLLPV